MKEKKINLVGIGQGINRPYCRECIEKYSFPNHAIEEHTLEELKELNPDVNEDNMTHCAGCGKYLL